MIETKASQRKKDYIFLELNVAAVSKGISEVKDLHETYIKLVNPIVPSSGYNMFSTKFAGKVRDEANKILVLEYRTLLLAWPRCLSMWTVSE